MPDSDARALEIFLNSISSCHLQCEVMVTAGANQAFTNVVLTLLDTESKVVLFKPYYFNHLMAIQMTGGAHSTSFGRCGNSNISTCILPLLH